MPRATQRDLGQVKVDIVGSAGSPAGEIEVGIGVPIEGGYLLASPFVARVIDPALRYDIEFEVDADKGRLVAQAVRVSRRKGRPPVNGEVLRDVPVESYLALIRQAAAAEDGFGVLRPVLWRTPTTVTSALGSTPEQLQRLEDAQSRRRPGRETQAAIVAEYRNALSDPERHWRATAAVAEALNYSQGHVSRVLTAARKERLLGPARPGRSGEELSSKKKKKGRSG